MTPDYDVISSELTEAGQSGVGLHVFERLDSTSIWLREHARALFSEGSPDQFNGKRMDSAQVCVTDWQSAGIARRGRTWQTRPGNITFSLLTHTDRQAKDLLGLSLVTGIAVATVLQEEFGLAMQLKWPNDLLVDDAKLGGLLTEILTETMPEKNESVNLVLTGIGINVVHDDAVLQLGIGGTSLAACGVDISPHLRDALIGKLAASVLTSHQQFFRTGWPSFAKQWTSYDWLADKSVSIIGDDSSEHAVARGVNEQGALMVERAGQVLPLYSGNISIRPTV